MHIAFLTPEYPHPSCTVSGGLGTSIKNLSLILVQKGVKVSLVIYGQRENKNFKQNGISFYLIKQKKYKIGSWYFHRKYLQDFLNILSKKENIDLVEAADWTGITAFMKLDVPVVIRLHGSDTYFCVLEGRKQKWKNRWFETLALKSADHLVSVSEFTGNKTIELFELKKQFTVIPNGVDVENFKASIDDIKPDQLFYFGTLIRKKGILELAEIFNIIVTKKPEAQLILAGRDVIDIKENISTLKLFKSKLNNMALKNFKHLGELNYDKVRKVLSESTVVVLPSFAEAFPMTWLEAMAMEKALVTSNIGWAQEIMLNGETGYMVHPREHQLYAERILELFQSKALRNEMGEKARIRIVENFSSERIVLRNLSFYESVLKQPIN